MISKSWTISSHGPSKIPPKPRRIMARQKRKGQMRDFSYIYPFTDNYCLFLVPARFQTKFNITLGVQFTYSAYAL